MGFRKDAYATVWEVSRVSDTMTKGRISVSRKDRQTGQYETDFSGFVSFIGTAAANKALNLGERDRIKLGDVDVSTRYDKETGKEYINYKVFSFEKDDGSGFSSQQSAPAEPSSNEPEPDEPLPF